VAARLQSIGGDAMRSRKKRRRRQEQLASKGHRDVHPASPAIDLYRQANKAEQAQGQTDRQTDKRTAFINSDAGVLPDFKVIG